MLNYTINLFLYVNIFFSSFIYGQNTRSLHFKSKELQNLKLFNSNIDRAYLLLIPLYQEANILKDSLSELKLLDRKCRYFYSKNMTDSLVSSSQYLLAKSKQFKNSYYESMAYVYISETYSINKLYDQAIDNLRNANKILDNINEKSKKYLYAKSNILNSYANIYLDKNEPEKAAQKINEEIASASILKDPDELSDFQYLNYSNLSSIYSKFNIDSAYYYANKSIRLKPSSNIDDKSMIINYHVLGQYFRKKKKYNKSIYNFHKSLTISKRIGIELNIIDTYQSLKEIYKEVSLKDSVRIYEIKIKEYDYRTLESKYKSLQKVIINDGKKNDKKTGTSSSPNNYAIFLIIISIILMIFFSSIYLKQKTFKEQDEEKKSNEIYKELRTLIEKKDPSFLFSFEQAFPKFCETLLKMQPDLQKSELELCAYLKLKFTTKEIATLTFIETRTVQNKKYRLRKKFQLPTSVDIYIWIDTI